VTASGAEAGKARQASAPLSLVAATENAMPTAVNSATLAFTIFPAQEGVQMPPKLMLTTDLALGLAKCRCFTRLRAEIM